MRLKVLFGFLFAIMVFANEIKAVVTVQGTVDKTQVVATVDVHNIQMDVVHEYTDVGYCFAEKPVFSFTSYQALNAVAMPSEGKTQLKDPGRWLLSDSKDQVAMTTNGIKDLNPIKRGYVKRHIGAGDTIESAAASMCIYNWRTIDLTYVT